MATLLKAPVFKRADLAKRLADNILQTSVGSAAASGLFLAAPRRTGKSTFLREDLRPELQRRNVLPLYVDLWADKKADPGDVIVNAVRSELSKHAGVVAKLAKSAGMEKVAVGGMTFSTDRVGLGTEVSLSTALAALSAEVKQPIVLLIDEAQHAITTQNGYDALFALKAARDELNSSVHHGLRVVATGSNRDKLAMLRNSKDQAFFSAPLVSFPVLGSDYVAWFCAGVNLPAALDPKHVEALFLRASSRPEILGAAADAVRFDLTLPACEVPARFAETVEEQIRGADHESLRLIHSLTPLQSAVLRVLAAHGSSYAPFEPPTLDAYRAALHSIEGHGKTRLDTSSVQQALLALQEKTLVWRETRGVYALEEATTLTLLTSEGLLDGVPTRVTKKAAASAVPHAVPAATGKSKR